MCFSCMCLFILHASVSILFLFLLVSGANCGLWLWHSLDFSIYFFWMLCSFSNKHTMFVDENVMTMKRYNLNSTSCPWRQTRNKHKHQTSHPGRQKWTRQNKRKMRWQPFPSYPTQSWQNIKYTPKQGRKMEYELTTTETLRRGTVVSENHCTCILWKLLCVESVVSVNLYYITFLWANL